MISIRSLVLFSLLLLTRPAFSQVNAEDIIWSSNIFATNVESDGATAFSGQWTFELGAFDPGFTPTPANIQQWAQKWNRLDRIGYNAGLRFFTESKRIFSTEVPFSPMDRGFVWGYKDGGSSSEWILRTGAAGHDWFFPELKPIEGINAEPERFLVGSDGVARTIIGSVEPSDMPSVLMRSAVVTNVTSPADRAYQVWVSENLTALQAGDPELAGPEGDANGNGISNLTEYAFALAATDREMPVLKWEESTTNPGEVEAYYTRPFNATDLTYIYEYLSPGLTWEPLINVNFEVSIASPNVEQVKLTGLKSTPGFETTAILRVRVERR